MKAECRRPGKTLSPCKAGMKMYTPNFGVVFSSFYCIAEWVK
jgi:hypothetical protein